MDNGASSYRRFLDGDEAAFIPIMETYRDGLIFFIDRYVHDHHAAEDISMDCFVELLVHRHRYNFQVSLKTYLYMLGRSRALSYLRRRRPQPAGQPEEWEALPDGRPTPEETVLADERRRQINAAIAALPTEMQTAVHLIYFEQMSYREAAKVMKKSEKQVDNLLYRAKASLRSTLEKEDRRCQ